MNNIEIEKSCFVDGTNIFLGKVKVGKNCRIIGSVIEDCEIGDNVCITNSVVEKSKIKNNVSIGPFAHLRGGCEICEDVRVGNFVEIKNSIIGARTKVAHLAYIGDAELGEDVNVGCGVIFANYDGKNKYVTKVGNRVFIGSNSNLVAPLFIEDDVFIACGTTVTNNLAKDDFCIGRVRNEIKKSVENPYSEKFKDKLKYFGTDGIRGVYGKTLTNQVAKKVGYGLSQICKNPTVVVGRDTRQSGNELFNHLAAGISFGDGVVVDLGVVPTACVSYLTRLLCADFGVMITASHNPSEYNGIKVFSAKGQKLGENLEREIENFIEKDIDFYEKSSNIIPAQKRAYIEFLESVCDNLENLDVYLDCANGVTSNFAPKLFLTKGANVVCENTQGEINFNAGVLNPDVLYNQFMQSKCEIGFAFDGDGDRVFCVTKKGVLDGDRILYILAKHFGEKFAVGTTMTNMGLEKHLEAIGTKLVRVDVGDKYIAKAIKSKKYGVGAEKSGHVIVGKYLNTGDGILTALVLSDIYKQSPQLFDEAISLKMYPSVEECVITENKKIIKTDDFLNFKVKQEKNILNGRIVVRASGTEPKIRILVENENIENAQKMAKKIKKYIEKLINK